MQATSKNAVGHQSNKSSIRQHKFLGISIRDYCYHKIYILKVLLEQQSHIDGTS